MSLRKHHESLTIYFLAWNLHPSQDPKNDHQNQDFSTWLVIQKKGNFQKLSITKGITKLLYCYSPCPHDNHNNSMSTILSTNQHHRLHHQLNKNDHSLDLPKDVDVCDTIESYLFMCWKLHPSQCQRLPKFAHHKKSTIINNLLSMDTWGWYVHHLYTKFTLCYEREWDLRI